MRAAFILLLALTASRTMAEDDALGVLFKSVESFTPDLFKELARGVASGGNSIYSGLGAWVFLTMAALGADGETAQQMRMILRLSADDDLVHRGVQRLNVLSGSVDKGIIEVANRLYLPTGALAKENYKNMTEEIFHSETAVLDLSQPSEAASLVNRWIDEATNHAISDILDENNLSSSLGAILLNGMTFKTEWAKPFADTTDKAFHLVNGTEVVVPTMFVSGKFLYGEIAELNAKFIEIPCKNEQIRFVVVIPEKSDGLLHIINNVELLNATQLANFGKVREVNVYLPRFRIESTHDLQEPLKNLDMVEAFSGNANFTRITKKPLKLGKVLQKALVEVNEGSVAATQQIPVSSTPSSSGQAEKVEFAANKPFYYQVIDRDYNVTLFSGLVYKPQGTNFKSYRHFM